MNKQLIKEIRMLLLLGSCLLVTACNGRASKGDDNETKKPVITVTIEPQRYFAEAIAGDKFEVVSMVPKGSSPETYDPIPSSLSPWETAKRISASATSDSSRVGWIA